MSKSLIHILKDDVARRIAAGEVIDRPAAVLRELLDNAIDAHAGEIAVYLEDGGNTRVRVVDNGTGMNRDDLGMCIQPHATSKITTLEDLNQSTSLGFRGEALSSIAACSRLQITSLPAKAKGPAVSILVEGGSTPRISEIPGNPGTIVDVSDIFFNMPARKKFLKRPATEGTMCRSVFIDKAAAFPAISFRLFTDNTLKTFLPAAAPDERIASLNSDAFSSSTPETIAVKHEHFSLSIICAPPHMTRRDRKLIQIFVNNRRINEYSLVQAVEYGFAGYIPGGLYPVAFLFVSIDPQLLDFNIHPAKREARFRNLPEIHSAAVLCIKSHLAKVHTTRPLELPGSAISFSGHESDELFSFASDELPAPQETFPKKLNLYRQSDESVKPDAIANKENTDPVIVFYGQLWKVFLLASRGDAFFLIDQHAAHERILYDELEKKEYAGQPLLVPLEIPIESDESAFLEKNRAAYNQYGITFELKDGLAIVNALPSQLTGCSAAEIETCIRGTGASPQQIRRNVLSMIACRAAIKEGDELDPLTAIELIKKTLLLPQQRCPHGRPVMQILGKEELLRRFERIV
ncbi:MAG: DNA mismatch repair endonuclease MutL [Spirochaetales bacterium]|nr:DNA mismatch repair endonuclease MutL [Spirochaetales bacterium]